MGQEGGLILHSEFEEGAVSLLSSESRASWGKPVCSIFGFLLCMLTWTSMSVFFRNFSNVGSLNRRLNRLQCLTLCMTLIPQVFALIQFKNKSFAVCKRGWEISQFVL